MRRVEETLHAYAERRLEICGREAGTTEWQFDFIGGWALRGLGGNLFAAEIRL
jgi:hypothetical protein